MKFKRLKPLNYLLWYCPGCKGPHTISELWQINENDVGGLTVSPSVRVSRTKTIDLEDKTLCHCFIKNGKIQFLTDCNHELAGTTVEMVDIPNEWL